MDDEEFVLKIAGRMLKKMGFETVLALNGEEAIDLFRGALEAGRFRSFAGGDAVIGPASVVEAVGAVGVDLLGEIEHLDQELSLPPGKREPVELSLVPERRCAVTTISSIGSPLRGTARRTACTSCPGSTSISSTFTPLCGST